MRCGGQARFVTLYGLGPAQKVKVASEWGASPFQTFGATIAASAKANKAKTAGVALVGCTLSGKPMLVQTIAVSHMLRWSPSCVLPCL